jgi:hypothetical protein
MVAEAAGELLGSRERAVGGWSQPARPVPQPALASSPPVPLPGDADALGQDWKLGTPALESEEVGWRLGAAWRLGGQ